MSRFCCIVGAGEFSREELLIPEGALVIAADAGLTHLESAGITPDLIVGDFDSLAQRPEGANVVFHCPEKDDTDMLLAVREALGRGKETLLIFGGLGGRPDHEFANFQTLAFIAEKGAHGFLVGRGFVCTVLQNGRMAFDGGQQGVLSVFCQGGRAEGVTLTGLKYPLTDHTLTNSYPLGVSNAFTGAPAAVSVRDGALLLMWQADAAGLAQLLNHSKDKD
jgi:thiamine pyrophosphokinase